MMMMIMNELHNNGEEQESIAVKRGIHYQEKRFSRLVAVEIASNLQVNWNSRDVVVNLLTSTLERQLCKRDGLLQQYLHTQLDIIADTIRQQFNIDENVGVNYNHATHAKFNDLLSNIKNMVISKDAETVASDIVPVPLDRLPGGN